MNLDPETQRDIGVIIGVLFLLIFWGALAYIFLHFVIKYW